MLAAADTTNRATQLCDDVQKHEASPEPSPTKAVPLAASPGERLV